MRVLQAEHLPPSRNQPSSGMFSCQTSWWPHCGQRERGRDRVIAGSEDKVGEGLVEKMQPLADGQRVRLTVLDGADHFFRDLYADDIGDAVRALLDKAGS